MEQYIEGKTYREYWPCRSSSHPIPTSVGHKSASAMLWLPGQYGLASPLLKIPILVTGTTLAILGQTPPNPPPEQDEADKYKRPGNSNLGIANITARYCGHVCKVSTSYSRFDVH